LRASYEIWIKTNLPFFDVLPIVRETAKHYAEIRQELKAAGTPIPSNHLWIAALARHHQMQLATRDSHFRIIQRLRVVVWYASLVTPSSDPPSGPRMYNKSILICLSPAYRGIDCG
jgi:hypothetical protein